MELLIMSIFPRNYNHEYQKFFSQCSWQNL